MPECAKYNSVLLALSGGIDSSVALMLLKEKGLLLHSATYQTTEDLTSIEEAKALASSVGVPHYLLDIRDEFRDTIIKYFIDEYLAARTPNPCVMCNPTIKWGKLLQLADALGCERLATGHYARIGEKNGRYFIRCGADARKDQSYFIYRLSQEQLARTIFPLGDLTKDEVREIAKAHGYQELAEKSESQEICFIADDDYRRFLRDNVRDYESICCPGNYVDAQGKVLGRHEGYPNYTIGQRKGLKIAFGEPRYVTRIDAERNEVTLGLKEDLVAKECYINNVVYQLEEDFEDGVEAMTKYRYKTKAVTSRLYHAGNGQILIKFEESADAVTPGQSAVCYVGDAVLCGGIIAKKS